MTKTTIGLDVGGAHLKLARVEDGRVVSVRQIACPLWEGIERLDSALHEVDAVIAGANVYAVTMTAELTEIFESREAGVIAIVQRLRERLQGELRIFMGLKGFASPEAALGDPLSIASANFLATARLIARLRPASLLIDMGSTTTDIIACDRPLGLTDAERLQTGELVYTGLTRTPVPSIATRAPLAGQWQGLARDAFATMADVRRILADLPMTLISMRRRTGAANRKRKVSHALRAVSDATPKCGICRRGKCLQLTSPSGSCERSTTAHCRFCPALAAMCEPS